MIKIDETVLQLGIILGQLYPNTCCSELSEIAKEAVRLIRLGHFNTAITVLSAPEGNSFEHRIEWDIAGETGSGGWLLHYDKPACRVRKQRMGFVVHRELKSLPMEEN